MRTGPGWGKKNMTSWLAWPHLLIFSPCHSTSSWRKVQIANSKQAALSFRPKRISIVAVMHTPMKPGKNNVWAFVIQYPNLWYNRGDFLVQACHKFSPKLTTTHPDVSFIGIKGGNCPFKIFSPQFFGGICNIDSNYKASTHDCGVSIYWYYIRLQYQIIWWTQNLNLHPGSRRKGTLTS